ncbi:MAG TPA: ATP-binding protein, partial [Chitinophagales bacterium]|nr:ATP-binding protein [Chitinophagales bacterium]
WKKAEKDLIIAEKLAVTGRVVRTLAHEIRNPLTNINLSTEQIEAESTDDSVHMYCDIIKRNARRINDLITQLLQSARPADVVLQRHALSELVEQTLELAADRIQLKNVKVEREFSTDPCVVNMDMEKMKTALLNIVINAVEAMKPDEGVLRIRTRNRDNQCELIVEDNGVGISKDNIARLFEPYFTSKSTGMGLGLATTHNIIKSHNGSIDVGSEPGRGTRFTIHLGSEPVPVE